MKLNIYTFSLVTIYAPVAIRVPETQVFNFKIALRNKDPHMLAAKSY